MEDLAGLDVSHNFWVGDAPADFTNGSGPGNQTDDPTLYTDPGDGAASFRLAAGSPARDVALAIPGVDVDFEGRERHTASSPDADMGAMEYGDPGAPCAFDLLFGL